MILYYCIYILKKVYVMSGNIHGLVFSSVTGTACFLWEKNA